MTKAFSAQWLAKFLKKRTNNKVRTKPDFIIGDEETPYMKRWFIIPRNRFFNIYLHEIARSDDDRALHDHPWWSLSIMLDGIMKEVVPINQSGSKVPVGQQPVKRRYVQAGDIVLRGCKSAHRLEIEEGNKCRTLFITGPRLREWGFHCPKGFVPWDTFTDPKDNGKIGRGCE